MALVFSIPGKTFLLGEYLALHGGPTLVALTQPNFELIAHKGSGSLGTIHSDSPAGKFISTYPDYFRQFDLEFKDPYQGKGGFGASTAQFLGVYSLWLYKEAHHQDMHKLVDLRHLLEAYNKVAWNGQGFPPSGADLVGQVKGSLTFFEKKKGLVSVASWPFADLEFYLIHTGNKLATHEHLRALGDFDSSGLEKSFAIAKSSFETHQSEMFVEAVNLYAMNLQALGFTCEPTLKLLADIRKHSGIKAIKGCGALGVDVLFAVVAKEQSQELKNYCQKNGLSIVASHHQISSGEQVSVKENL
ncbi:hypothetical protein [Bdellovibrio svalbardensis]|uniref:GHMP kinase N-terminal domain-containing protein n=1 Tax=Bdellovibrio svalbardensis TaxID=2972972 RepID=A0ABT6DKL1_9BACT|nr:hypothetical protein [Bdellovibrio svalbardensis]MDG0817405.1 hypothetical protein [Bdellovibrio svalbardensis]